MTVGIDKSTHDEENSHMNHCDVKPYYLLPLLREVGTSKSISSPTPDRVPTRTRKQQ